MKLALCQMNVVQGQVESNRLQAKDFICEAARNGAQVVVLPEMWTCGYDFQRLQLHTESELGPTSNLLAGLARDLGVYIVGGSFPVRYGAGVANTSMTFDDQGKTIHTYRKVHLIGLMEEDKYLVPGDGLSCFFLNDGLGAAEEGLASTVICYDLRFPELARSAVLQGAKILFVPAQWPVQRQSHWETLLRARAIENQCFVVGVNVSGHNANDTFTGGSQVIDPWGDAVAQAGEKPGILYGEISLNQVDEVRNRVPSLRDRRPQVYARLNSSQ